MKIQLSDHFTYKKLLRFCLSPIIMMVFTSLYGVVDGVFVANYVGKTEFAAINLIMPFIMIFGGIGFMIGTGGTALVAKTLGEKDDEKANRYFTMMVWTSLIVGIIISVIGIIFIRPISIMLGADESMIDHCVLYGRIILGFNTAFMLQNLFQSFLITAEKPKLGLWATVASGLTNMVLDYLFVGVFGFGLSGAAYATGISQCVGGLLPLFYFMFPNTSLLRLVKTKLLFRPILKACANGASEIVSSVTSSIVGILYNFKLLEYAGSDGVAAYGVLMYTEFIFIAVFIGFVIGSAPIISYHYGAKNHFELNSLFKKSVVFSFVAGFLMLLISELCALPLSSIFVGYDKNLLNMTVSAFRVYSLVFVFAGFNIFASSFFTALNNGLVSAIISFFRTFVFKTSAVMILPLIFGLNGIWWATITAEIIAFFVSLAFIILNRKKYHY